MIISTHILDLSTGSPASNVSVRLDCLIDGKWINVGHGTTDSDGRVKDLVNQAGGLGAGEYKVSFATGEYFQAQGKDIFYPEVVIQVRINDSKYHLPLLLSPFGYSTYRGS